MEIEKVNVNVPEGYKGAPIEIVLREGQAPKVNEPVAFGRRKVAVSSLFNLIATNKYSTAPEENPGILYYCLQHDKLGLEFHHDPSNDLAPKLFGDLELNPDFIAFGINKEKTFGGKALMNHIRKYAHCFINSDQPTAFIKALQNFEIKFEQVHKKEDDRKGNVNEQVRSALKFTKGEIPLSWDLKLPLFKGTPDVEFSVEIEIDAEQGSPVFSFYSMEVELLLRDSGKELILTEVEKFKKQFTTLETV